MKIGTKTTITSISTPVTSETEEKKDSYYDIDGLPECKEIIEGMLTSYSNSGILETKYLFYLGNVIKYLYRAPNKGGLEDLKKAHEYLSWIINEE